MHFARPSAQLFVPDGTREAPALARTTRAAIGAHQDDIPIMALDGILKCHDRQDRWFLGVTVTTGGGSPRAGEYADYSDAQMRATRAEEENAAAATGNYGACVQLDYPSPSVLENAPGIVDDLAAILATARADVIYTHNLADRHDTHVAVTLRTIAAIRSLPKQARPKRLYGCEVWGDLDWLSEPDRVAFDVSDGEELAEELMAAYRSQTAGGKRYDVATAGRRAANAIFLHSHEVDAARSVTFAMDLTPLIVDETRDPAQYVLERVHRLGSDVAARIGRAS